MPAGRDDRSHWGSVYADRAIDEVSWYQAEPTVSLELIGKAGVDPASAIIDVGGGASVLAERLVTLGFEDVTVLDVSGEALAASRGRMAARADQVTWVEADLLQWRPGRRYDVWHDRAVFHFLTTRAERLRYVQTVRSALAPDGAVVLGTFASDGPDRCSGLPTSRYAAEELAAQFPGFETMTTRREEHHTPAGALQPFTWVLLRNAG
jgi:trans-aconitate methyltransferase